jgi:hypothetical protein
LKKVKLAQVRRLVKKWQPILGLTDYSITIEVVDGEPYRYGHVLTSDEAHRARIVINQNHDEVSQQAGSIGEANLEETVVHEMLHIVLIQLKEYASDVAEVHIGGDRGTEIAEVLRRIEERTVDKLSLALVRKFNGV